MFAYEPPFLCVKIEWQIGRQASPLPYVCGKFPSQSIGGLGIVLTQTMRVCSVNFPQLANSHTERLNLPKSSLLDLVVPCNQRLQFRVNAIQLPAHGCYSGVELLLVGVLLLGTFLGSQPI